MSHSFFTQFRIDECKHTLIFGDRFKIALVRQLAEESVKIGYHALITSFAPETYPVEGKVLVIDDITLLTDLIKDDQPEVIYIASNVKNDLLQPFEIPEINRLAKQLGEKMKLFMIADPAMKKSLSGLKVLKKAKLLCSLNYNILKENLPDINHLKNLKRKSSSEQLSEQMFKSIESLCPKFIEIENETGKICFIGQVKSMFDENVILPVIRNLRTRLNSRILIGDINTYHLKEV